MNCILCGREMWKASYFIGDQPVGDTCAKKANLPKLVKMKGGNVKYQKIAVTLTRPARDDMQTFDLFEGME